MKRLILLVIAFLAISCTYAQTTGKITGIVFDSSVKAPLEYATISIYSGSSNAPLDGTTSDKSGHFTLEGIQPGTYTVLVEFIGFQSVRLASITISTAQPIKDLGKITLIKKQETLQNIVVTAQGKLVENKIDKMVFNAERDVTSQTGAATDVLKKVPQVSVDVDGNVELAGSSSVRFLINGKPSSAFGSNISDVLQAIPANQIKSIEVITSPGAKYDAEGMGGIINIILKKSNTRGVNGNISLSAGTRNENGSFNFNARRGKLGINAFVSGNYRPRSTTHSSSDRYSKDSLGNDVDLRQEGTGRFQRHGFQTGAGFDYTINDHNSLSGAFSYNRFGYSGQGQQSQDQVTSSMGTILSQLQYTIPSNNSFLFENYDASLNYKKTFQKEDQELDIAASTSLGNRVSTNNNQQWILPQDSLIYGINSVNPGKENVTQVQVDYTQPFKKDVTLGVGGKTLFTDITSNARVLSYSPSSKTYLQDPYLSNYLDYHQKVYAAYAELGFPIGSFLSAKVGGRIEHTEINAFYSNAQKQVPTPPYNSFVPSLYLSHKLSDNQTLKFSYSRRIGRPDYEDLNPFINTSDPKNLNSGNPYLKPEIGNRFELGYNYDIEKLGSLMVNLSYRTSDHDIQPFVVYYPTLEVGDTTYTNVSLSTRENIGLEKNLGMNVFLDMHVTSKLTMRTNAFFFHRHIINAVGQSYNPTSLNYRLNLNATYQFTTNVLAEFFGNFNSARNEVQGRYPSWIFYSFAIRKQFWNKKGSLALTANNPFAEYINQKTDLKGTGFTMVSERQIPFRSFGINFTWKFGKLEFKKDKEETHEAPMGE